MLSGCATKPTPGEMASADYGSYPDAYQTIIQNYMGHLLKDPYSARYEYLNQPKKGWARGPIFGYVVCVNVNARNSYGGYTGAQPSYFMIHDDRIISTTHGDGRYMDAIVEGRCREFVGG